jgi:hydroxymethylpyrimidine/phosphomethylpyrimidine kinase
VTSVLIVAGSDPSGGAGLELDLKVIARHGIHAAAVATCLTDQTAEGFEGCTVVPLADGLRRIRALLATMPVRAVKIGLLPTEEWIDAIAAFDWSGRAVVLDPVLTPSRGDGALAAGRTAAHRRALDSGPSLVTPNLDEAAALLGVERASVDADPVQAARELVSRGARAALLKGGHAGGHRSVDILAEGARVVLFATPRASGPPPRGTGCALSSAVSAELARGAALEEAVERSVGWLREAIEWAAPLGAGMPYLDLWRPGRFAVEKWTDPAVE